jgi:hypothetical protein
MKRATLIGGIVLLLALPIPALAEPIQATLYKNLIVPAARPMQTICDRMGSRSM